MSLTPLAHTDVPIRNERLREHWRKVAPLLLSLVVGLCVLALPLPAQAGPGGEVISLSQQGRAVFAVTALCIVLWVTEALPFAATALLVFALLPLTGAYAGTVPQRLARLLADSVGSPVVAFLFGVMLLGVAVNRSGLGLRVARIILRLSAGKPRRVLFGFVTVSAVLGMWITPVATASIMVPLAVGLLTRMNCLPGHSRFGKALLMAVTWGSLSGGIATPAGTTSNPIVIDFLRNLAEIEIGFLNWMRVGLPAVALLIPCAWLLLVWLFPPEIERCELSLASSSVRSVHAPDGSCPETGQGAVPATSNDAAHQADDSSDKQIRIALLLVVAVTVWIAAPPGWITWSALLFSTLVFLPGIGLLRWQEAERDVSWGTLLVVAAGIAIGTATYQSGLARYLSHLLFARMLITLPAFWRPAALSWATALLHAVFSSNTVTGSIIAPLLIPLAQDLHLGVWHTLAPAAYSVSLAFLLVTETPTSLIAYQAGYFSARDYVRAGLPLTLVAGLVLAFVLWGTG